ncbi:MAG: hypothetical protein KAR21_11960, partial [Spirochaetales bacterium]|nr:hypothetical protein [Spirochaetales bacterium]
MISRIMFNIRITLVFMSSIIFIGCPEAFDPNSSHNTVVWTGAWENDTEFFGTFTLNMTFEGENLLYNGGNGTISGSVSWKGLNGQDLVADTIGGTWSNGLSDNHARLEFSISSTGGNLTFDDFIHYETAGEITSNTFSIGSFSLDSNSGSWYTEVDNDISGTPDVTSAVLINQDGEFLDITYIDGSIYAAVFDDPDYKIVSINISNGSVTDLTAGITCSEPMAIAYDGTDSWVVGRENTPDTDLSLFKYSGIDFTTNTGSYPLSHEDLSWADAISFSGPTLNYHNGSVLSSQIGSINTSTAVVTAELFADWGSLPDMCRTAKIAAIPDAYYSVFFAAGGEWSAVRKLNTSGELISSFYCPVNGSGPGPITINGDKMYIIEDYPNRLYV